MLNNQLESCPAEKIASVNFFQIVRSIERETGLRLGSDLGQQEEPVKLRADLDAQFPSTEVASWDSSKERPELSVSFFGLFGASGALPQHYSEMLTKRSRIKDFALRDFLDMFNHRLLSFFYRCWEKHQFPIAYETAHAAGQQDRFTGALRGLTGTRTVGLWDQLSFPSRDMLFFSAHFANRRPTADAIQSMVASAFNLSVRVEQFVGQLMFVEPSEQTRLGNAPLGVSMGNQLGTDAIAGEWVWDYQNKFRVRIGPVGFQRFSEFHPQSKILRQLWDLIRAYVGPQYDFDVQFVLKKNEVPTCQLGNQHSAQLGWNTWIGDWKETYDAEDAVFQLSD